MKKTPWLSVIICTYQGEKFLTEALLSIEMQHSNDIEIIAIDDGSTDSTLAILDEFSKRMPIRKIAIEHTGNWITNTNRGISEASGEFISFLHQDDIWASNRLQVLRDLSSKNPECGIFFHPSYYINSTGKQVGRWTLPFPQKDEIIKASHFLERLIVQNLLAIPSPMFKKEVAVRAGAMREDLWFLADWEYWGRLTGITIPYICSDFLASFRIHRASQTVTRSQNGDDLRQQYHNVIATIATQLSVLDKKQLTSAINAAYMNCEVSIMLALMTHGKFSNFGRVCKVAFRLRPDSWLRFWRDSRLWQRLQSRLQAQF